MRVDWRLLAAVLWAGTASAQPLVQAGGPAEAPPVGYGGNQYVDTRGCVFLRAGVGGRVVWVPRVDRERKPVCGYDPTFPPGLLDDLNAVIADARAQGKTPAEPALGEPASAGATAGSAAPVEAPVAAAEARPAAPAPASAQPAAAQPASARAAAARPATGVKPAPAAAAGATKFIEDHRVIGYETLCPRRLPYARRYLLGDGRRVTDCSGRPPDEPVARLNALAIPGLEVSSVPPTAEERARARAIEAGGRYAVVWKSGALRHEPAAKGSAAPAASPAGAAASAGPATSQPVPARARYVQIGAFADPVNAERAIGRMRTLGLPVAIADQTRNGRAIRTIFVGPYEAASDVALALQVARRGGYADAFAR